MEAASSSKTTLPILHFNDVYRVSQSSSRGTLSADQFAAKIASIRTEKWGEDKSRALDFLKGIGVNGSDNDEADGKEEHDGHQASTPRPGLHGLTLFSGDALNPSIESSVTRGAHMVEVLNAMSIDCACIGNHDFDFGWPHLGKMMRQCNFPWMLSNIADVGKESIGLADEAREGESPQEADKVAEGTLPYWVGEVQGIRVGCIGLVERDWIATVPAFPPFFRYRSMVEVAKDFSCTLRDPQGPHRCDIVITLTHCRLPNDIDLANDLGAVKGCSPNEHGVDLVLGGHDHTYYVGHGVDEYTGEEWRNSMPGQDRDHGCMVVKSGTDFHDLSEITLELSEADDKAVRRRRIIGAKVQRHSTTSKDPTLPELKAHIDELMQRVDKATGQPVAFSLSPLDCRMDKVRAQESPVGNLIADILMHSYDALLRERDERGELGDDKRPKEQRQVDMAFICGGSLRGDSVFGPGIITLRDILSIMPFEDSVIVRNLKGSDILEALENAVGAYPSLEGRFPQLAGLSVVWDSSRPKGQRLVEVRLLEDVHLFTLDGKPNEQHAARRASLDEASGSETPPSEGQESYVFERSEEGGYSIEVNKPRIRKGPRLDPNAVYRVCTREYMGDGHDGYAALTRAQGPDIVDHENGSLMSTQVRKFLLGASLIWRLKSFRDNSDESGRGFVGSSQSDKQSDKFLSAKTHRAIERAYALSNKPPKDRNDDGSGMATPQRKNANRIRSIRMVVDSSPGGIRDAMHVGASEHHSDYDAASKTFHSSRKRRTKDKSSLANGGDASMDSSWVLGTDDDDTYSSTLSASATSQDGSDRQRHSLAHTKASDMSSDTSAAISLSPTFSDDKRTFQEHIQVSAHDGQALRDAASDLAIIVPLRDGRLVDVALKKKVDKPSK